METTLIDFKDYFKLPLTGDYGLVFTADNNRAFDFPNSWSYPKGLSVTEESRANVIAAINGTGKPIQTDLKLSHENGIIYSDLNGRKQEFIIIRGWGMLTGTGGYRLKDDLAAIIQDAFANHIIQSLTVAETV